MKNWMQWGLILGLCAPGAAFAIGAFAIDDEAGDYEAGYGIATGADTKEEAYEMALQYCRDAGNASCRKVSWFKTCGSYAASKEHYGAGWGKTASAAQQMAMEKCGEENCRIVETECEE